MANYKVTDTELTSVANAIRTKGGTQAQLEFPTGFVTAIGNIPSGSATLITKNITQNGTYNASSDSADGYSSVTVNVSGGASPVNRVLLSPGYANTFSLIQGRVATGFNASYGYLAPADNNGWMDIDWSGDWEIGVAFKVDSVSGNFALFGQESSTSDFSAVPSIEVIGTDLDFGISSQANAWDLFIYVAQNLVANTWYFVSTSYDHSTMVVTNRITTDFTQYDQVTNTLSAAPYHNSNRKIGFGGLVRNSSHTKTGAYIDLHNTYIKVSGSIVWGAFTGAFPV